MSQFAWTHRWRRQSAANPSRKWSSESRVFGGSDGKIWRRGTTCNRLDRPTAWGKGPFCRLSKERGGSTRSKFVQYGRLFSQLRFKAHNIGGLGHDYQSGILWSAYPMKLWALVPCRHRMQKKHAETRPQETPHHPERLTRSRRNEGPSVVL